MEHQQQTDSGLPATAYKELPPGQDYTPLMPASTKPAEVTPWSVIVGLLMAVLFSAAAAYSGLKIGQVFEAAIPIAILAVGLSALFRIPNPMGQNVIIQSIGASSGVIVAGAIVRGWVAGNAGAGIELAVRGLLALGTLLLLSAHLPPAELARWLRARGISADLVGTMLLLIRYGDLLRQEAYRLDRARRSRCFSGTAETSWTAKSTLLGALFARAVARAERVYRAMLARGWQ